MSTKVLLKRLYRELDAAYSTFLLSHIDFVPGISGDAPAITFIATLNCCITPEQQKTLQKNFLLKYPGLVYQVYFSEDNTKLHIYTLGCNIDELDLDIDYKDLLDI